MHWYKFHVQGSSDLFVCHAPRKKDIEMALDAKLVFLGCVDKQKIPMLRACPFHTVFNSVNNMLAIMKAVNHAS